MQCEKRSELGSKSEHKCGRIGRVASIDIFHIFNFGLEKSLRNLKIVGSDPAENESFGKVIGTKITLWACEVIVGHLRIGSAGKTVLEAALDLRNGKVSAEQSTVLKLGILIFRIIVVENTGTELGCVAQSITEKTWNRPGYGNIGRDGELIGPDIIEIFGFLLSKLKSMI